MKIRKEEKLILQSKNVKRCIAWISTCALMVSLLACMGPMSRETAQAAVTLHNPTYDSGVQEVAPTTESTIGKIHNPVYNADTDETTWDCVWFGNYWQSDTNGDGVADKNDEKEPIKWRVLSVDGDDVFLMADKNLDVKPYNETDTNVTWETCTLRSWLNGYGTSENVCGKDYASDNFLDEAFSKEEQAEIKTATIINEDNSYWHTEGGNNTMDKVCLLSLSEVSNPAYGFNNIFVNSHTRIALNTAYVAEYSGMSSVGETNDWWLRSPGKNSNYAADVDTCGDGSYSYVSNDDYDAIRPALHLPFSTFTLLSYAGTVYSNAGGTATWDCVYFGNYWQSDTNGDGVADKKDDKEPIKWRVLSVNRDDVFLLADANLDVKLYNEEDTDVTWESNMLRSWLNGYGGSANGCWKDYTTDNFIDSAFSVIEQMAIKNTNVSIGVEGGNNTMDKIYLLSFDEVSNLTYGFCPASLRSDTRVALNTVYVADYECEYGGMNSVGVADYWWLRSPNLGRFVAAVGDDGYSVYYGAADGSGIAVRPALHLDLSNTSLWSYAGTVCSDGTVTDADGNIQTPTPIPTVKPTVTPTAKPTAIPTVAPTPGMIETPVSPTKSPVGNETDSTPVVGQAIKDTNSKAFYQVVSTSSAGGTVSYIRPETKAKKAKVPAVIYYNGKKYKVTSVAAKAFAGNKKLKTVVIGKNVKKIQKKAFANCKNLSKVTVKSKVLNKVAKNAFKGTNKKLTVKVPKKKKAKYGKLFKGKGNTKLKIK